MGRWISLICFSILLAAPATGLACPNCKDAVASSADGGDDDPFREAKAYNYSIYLMVSAPYLLIGTVSFLGYRAYRANRPAPE